MTTRDLSFEELLGGKALHYSHGNLTEQSTSFSRYESKSWMLTLNNIFYAPHAPACKWERMFHFSFAGQCTWFIFTLSRNVSSRSEILVLITWHQYIMLLLLSWELNTSNDLMMDTNIPQHCFCLIQWSYYRMAKFKSAESP